MQTLPSPWRSPGKRCMKGTLPTHVFSMFEQMEEQVSRVKTAVKDSLRALRGTSVYGGHSMP